MAEIEETSLLKRTQSEHNLNTSHKKSKTEEVRFIRPFQACGPDDEPCVTKCGNCNYMYAVMPFSEEDKKQILKTFPVIVHRCSKEECQQTANVTTTYEEWKKQNMAFDTSVFQCGLCAYAAGENSAHIEWVSNLKSDWSTLITKKECVDNTQTYYDILRRLGITPDEPIHVRMQLEPITCGVDVSDEDRPMYELVCEEEMKIPPKSEYSAVICKVYGEFQADFTKFARGQHVEIKWVPANSKEWEKCDYVTDMPDDHYYNAILKCLIGSHAAPLVMEISVEPNPIYPKSTTLQYRIVDSDVSESHQMLEFMFDRTAARSLRRMGTEIWQPDITPEGHNTRHYVPFDTITEWIPRQVTPHAMFPTEYAAYTKHNGMPSLLRDHLQKQPDARFPDVNKCSALWSFRNGILHIWDQVFYLYVGHGSVHVARVRPIEQLDSKLSTAHYFDILFPLHLLNQ